MCHTFLRKRNIEKNGIRGRTEAGVTLIFVTMNLRSDDMCVWGWCYCWLLMIWHLFVHTHWPMETLTDPVPLTHLYAATIQPRPYKQEQKTVSVFAVWIVCTESIISSFPKNFFTKHGLQYRWLPRSKLWKVKFKFLNLLCILNMKRPKQRILIMNGRKWNTLTSKK